MGDAQSEMLKEALNIGSDALEKYRLKKWLSDDRKNGPLPAEIIEWGETEWHPRVIGAGWQYWANVVPEELVAAGTLVPIMNNLYKLGLRMQVFTNLDDAQNWLDGLN